ncbi:MAG: NmrA family NAD(P)-binding protein [Pseudomonadales bacterium]
MTEIVVFGATGLAGAEAVRSLIKMGIRPRVFTRSTKIATSLFGDAVTTIEGDFDNEASLKSALQGVESVFLSSPVNPRQVAWQGQVLKAAAPSRPLVVKLAGLATTPESFVDSGRWHAETEHAIQQLELPYVFLHPNFFMQNFTRTVPPALQSGTLAVSDANVPIAPVDVRDIGAVAAQLLAGRVDRTGATLTLTAAETFTYHSLADLLSELSGRSIEVLERSDTDTRELLLKAQMPEWHIAILLQFNQAFRDRLGCEVTTDVEDALGRPPLSLRNYLEELTSDQPEPTVATRK